MGKGEAAGAAGAAGAVGPAATVVEERGEIESVLEADVADAVEVVRLPAVVAVKLFAEVKVVVVTVKLDAGGWGIVVLVEDFVAVAVTFPD